MKLSMLIKRLGDSSLAFMEGYKVSPGALLMGVDVVISHSSKPFVMGEDRKLFISKAIEELSDKGYPLVGVRDNGQNIMVSKWDMGYAALLGTLLHWPARSKFYIYSFIDVLRRKYKSQRIDPVSTTAAILDYAAYDYISSGLVNIPFEKYLVSVLKDYITNEHNLHRAAAFGSKNFLFDIFGLTENIWEAEFSRVALRHVTTPMEALRRAVGSNTAGRGRGGVEDSFIASLITPRSLKWMDKIEAIARAYVNSTKTEAKYTMDPPDFTYWRYKVILADWRLEPKNEGQKGLFFVVDTSGSVSEYELQMFVNEVYSIVKKIPVVGEVVWFSGGVEGTLPLDKITTPEIKPVGRGGTELAPALEYVRDKIKAEGYEKAAVIVLSDGGIFDVDDVIKLGKITEGLQLFFYTKDRVEFPGWEVVKFEA